MSLKEFLRELDELVLNSCPTNKDYYLGMKVGAQTVIEIQKEAARKKAREYRKEHPGQPSEWRKRNREAYNAYHREYRRRKKEDLTMKDG